MALGIAAKISNCSSRHLHQILHIHTYIQIRTHTHTQIQERLEDKVALGIIQQRDIGWFIETLTSPDILTELTQLREKEKGSDSNRYKHSNNGTWQSAMRRKNRKLVVFRQIDSKRDNVLDLDEVTQFYNGNSTSAKHLWDNIEKSAENKISWMDFANSAISEGLSNAIPDTMIDVNMNDDMHRTGSGTDGIVVSPRHWRYDRARRSFAARADKQHDADVRDKLGYRPTENKDGGINAYRPGVNMYSGDVKEKSLVKTGSRLSIENKYVGNGDYVLSDEDEFGDGEWDEDALVASMRAYKVDRMRKDAENMIEPWKLPYAEMVKREGVVDESLKSLFPDRCVCLCVCMHVCF